MKIIKGKATLKTLRKFISDNLVGVTEPIKFEIEFTDYAGKMSFCTKPKEIQHG